MHFIFLVKKKQTNIYLFGCALRITSWNQNVLAWKRPLRIILFQPPCQEQGHLPLDQVAQTNCSPCCLMVFL